MDNTKVLSPTSTPNMKTPPESPRRREALQLGLQLQRSNSEPDESNLKAISPEDLARKIRAANETGTGAGVGAGGAARPSFLLLDTRGYLTYTENHIATAVHMALDRINRKRIMNSGSVLDLVSNFSAREQMFGGRRLSKWREVIVYDEGTDEAPDMEKAGKAAAPPLAFVLHHLIQENRTPYYLKGGIKEFAKNYKDLCENCSKVKKPKINPEIPALSELSERVMLTSALPPNLIIPPPAAPESPSTPDAKKHKPPVEDHPITQVLPYLYIGNARDSMDLDMHKKCGISHIISITKESPPTIGMPNKQIKWFSVSDSLTANLMVHFKEAFAFIDEARDNGTNCLIHCHAGVSRSSTVAIAYMLNLTNFNLVQAYAFVQRYRPIISPNLNFMGQLVEFERQINIERGIISSDESLSSPSSPEPASPEPASSESSGCSSLESSGSVE